MIEDKHRISISIVIDCGWFTDSKHTRALVSYGLFRLLYTVLQERIISYRRQIEYQISILCIALDSFSFTFMGGLVLFEYEEFMHRIYIEFISSFLHREVCIIASLY